MNSTFVTKQDLLDLKKELLDELQILLDDRNKLRKRWLRNDDVTRLLQISPNTLQNLRKTNTIPYFKIKGIIYYSYEDIENMMEYARQNHDKQ